MVKISPMKRCAELPASDEVYANSLFASTDYPSPPVFTSVLALEIKKYIDPSMVHCLYGMSKVSLVVSMHYLYPVLTIQS